MIASPQTVTAWAKVHGLDPVIVEQFVKAEEETKEAKEVEKNDE